MTRRLLRVQQVKRDTTPLRLRAPVTYAAAALTASPWQNAAIKALLPTSTAPHCLLVAPEGSGKTVIIKAIGSDWLLRGYAVLILVPQNSIKSGYSSATIHTATGTITWPSPTNIDNPDCTTEGEVSGLIQFLRLHELRPDPIVWVCSYAAFFAAIKKARADGRHLKFGNVAIVYDEGHHSAGEGEYGTDVNSTGQFLVEMLVEGIPHMICTATPFRSDNRRLIPDSYRDRYRSYTRERADDLADKRYIAGITTRVLMGNVEAILDDEFAKIKQNRDKALVKLPKVLPERRTIDDPDGSPNPTHYANVYATQLGVYGAERPSKYAFEEHLSRLAKRHGLTFLSIATAESNEANGARLQALMSAVRERPFDTAACDALPDIVLVQDRYKEGTDCPPWSICIQIGLSSSIVELRQFPGRMMRDHPSKEGKFMQFLTVIPELEVSSANASYALETTKGLVILGMISCEHLECCRLPVRAPSPSDVERILIAADDVVRGEVNEDQRTLLNTMLTVTPELQEALDVQPPRPALTAVRASGDDAGRLQHGLEECRQAPERPDEDARGEERGRFRLRIDTSMLSDSEILRLLRVAYAEMAKSIGKTDAKEFAARLAKVSSQSRLLSIETMYRDGVPPKNIMVRLGVPEHEVLNHLKGQGLLRWEHLAPTRRRIKRPRV